MILQPRGRKLMANCVKCFFGPLGVSGKGLKPWWGVPHSAAHRAESGTPSSVLEEKCGITTT